jgi:hypothetical protein
MSDYPNGFTDGLTIRGLPIAVTNPGEIFWVNGSSVLAKGGIGGSDGNKGTYQQPFATIDYAIGRCTASRGDIIMVMPGHTETVSAAGTIACDVAGVSIVGLGTGTARPKVSFSAAAGSITVSVANVAFKNIVFSAEFADVADAFTLTTAKNFTLEDCQFQDDAADENFVEIVDTSTVDNAADGLTILRCKWISPDLSTTSLVNVDADLDQLMVHDCYIDLGVNGVLSTIAEVAAGKDLTNVDIRRNYSSRLVAASAVQLITFADTTTTNTGIMEDNRCRSLDVAGELLLSAGTNISQYNNTSTSVIDLSGYVLPAIDG